MHRQSYRHDSSEHLNIKESKVLNVERELTIWGLIYDYSNFLDIVLLTYLQESKVLNVVRVLVGFYIVFCRLFILRYGEP